MILRYFAAVMALFLDKWDKAKSSFQYQQGKPLCLFDEIPLPLFLLLMMDG